MERRHPGGSTKVAVRIPGAPPSWRLHRSRRENSWSAAILAAPPTAFNGLMPRRPGGLFCEPANSRLEAGAPVDTNENTTQPKLRWCLSYYLTAHCGGLSIYLRFSQSFTKIGLLATVSGRRRPEVSTAPLGSKYPTLGGCSPVMHISIEDSRHHSSPPNNIGGKSFV